MAAKKNPKRSSPRKGGHHKPKKGHHRRRRNPSGDFGSRLGRLAIMAGVGVGTAVLTTIGAAKIMPGSPVTLYGIPIATGLIGVALAKKFPTVGPGVAVGSVAPFALPLASKALTAMQPASPSQTAAGIQRAYRTMRAVHMGRMGAVHMGAVHAGAYA